MRDRLIIVGLALFVALDLVLVTLAVRHVRSPPASATVSHSSAARSSSPAPTAVPTDTSTTSTSAAGVAPVSFLAVGVDSTLLRAPRGGCSSSSSLTVGVSDDNGGTFAQRRVPGLHEILGVRVASRHDLTLIGLGTHCRLGHYASHDDGQTWTGEAGGGGMWHLSGDRTARTIASPQGRRTTPCVPSAVSTVAESLVRVLCGNGQVLGTDDVGLTWVALGTLAGAVDIRFSSAGGGLALARQPGCPAAVMQTVDGGTHWSRLGCVPGTGPRAIGSEGGVVAAQVGKELYVSTNGGTTWPAPAGG